MKTKIQIIKDMLLAGQDVSNIWAVKNYILRLSSIIYDLRKDGMNIDGKFLFKKGQKSKEFIYYKV